MMAKVEGMPMAALEHGVAWDWRPSASSSTASTATSASTPASSWATARCAAQVMGADAVGKEATPEQIEAMKAGCHAPSTPAASGFSTTQAYTHSDGDGQPVPSRWATPDEVLALCAVVGEHEGTTLEVISTAASRASPTTRSSCHRDVARRPPPHQLERAHGRLRASPTRYRHQLAASK